MFCLTYPFYQNLNKFLSYPEIKSILHLSYFAADIMTQDIIYVGNTLINYFHVNCSSLPPVWDSHASRADPDGAPSSSASSPTSAPPGKHTNNRKASVSSDEHHRKKECRIQQQSQTPREYKDYRSKYYDWAGSNESSSHLEIKQTTVHPKVVCDIPKSSHVFVDTNVHTGKPNSNSTPRSDNYR